MSKYHDLESDIDDIIALTLGLLLKNRLSRKGRKPKRWHVRPYYKDRKQNGRYFRDIPKLRKDPELFKETFRVTPTQFDELFQLLRDQLKPIRNTRPQDRITEEEKLYITLEYLGSGTLFRHLANVYKCGKTTVQTIISDTCRVIANVMKPVYMPIPTAQVWVQVANEYNGRWNLPNCIGSVDGKHVEIKCPKKAGSIFYCHKGFHSIILMAIAGPDYRFLYVDTGAYGSEGDSTVFRECNFGKALYLGNLDIPPPQLIFGKPIPFYLAADDAFPLNVHIMKPFSLRKGKGRLESNERQFNYRLSRGRRCVENAFGILSARWYCLARMLPVGPDSAQAIVDACCVLHNYLLKKTSWYCPAGFTDSFDETGNLIPGKWRDIIKDKPAVAISKQVQGRPTEKCVQIRNQLMEYVCSAGGILKWQENYS